jgi:alkylhydroperoxidase family enzyme
MPTPRIPPLPAEERDPRIEEVLQVLRAPDGGELNIFTTLARHPKVFKRWSDFGGVLLYAGRLSPRERELLILRTGWNCRSPYEYGQHVLIGLRSGLSQEEIDRVPAGPDDPAWSPEESDLLRAADELHQSSCISDATWAALAARLDEQQLIEVCMLVGQYHLVAFTLNSLGVEPEPDLPPMPAAGS